MTCSECKIRMFPEDPSQPFYLSYPECRYLPALCESCSGRYSEVNPTPQIVEYIHRHSDMSKQEFDLLQQTAREVKYLRGKLAELQARKPKERLSTYEGLTA